MTDHLRHSAPNTITLGIWDGHDAGAALVSEGEIIYAINEERLSRRKLEVGFPKLSIENLLRENSLTPENISRISVSTSDFAKTLTRVIPSLKEEYYLLRRRNKLPGFSYPIKKAMKYGLTEWPPSVATKRISTFCLESELKKLGFAKPNLEFVDHHLAHIASAAYTSGFSDALVISLDGLGDGLSGRICSLAKGELSTLAELPAKSSFGIFFEHVTNLLNMRELEDEGKVMALADYSLPLPPTENYLLDFFTVEGLNLKTKYSSHKAYRQLKKILWRTPSEVFAQMAQRTLEIKIRELVVNALERYPVNQLALAGGVASNVKVNMLLAEIPGVQDLYVFPHMGDGGLAAGAALWAERDIAKKKKKRLEHTFFGPSYSSSKIATALESYSHLKTNKPLDLPQTVAALILSAEIVMWFQGRMEFGPRALGGRSILALPNSLAIKDDLNLKLKKRVWYQPFCPVMLETDAQEILCDYKPPPNPLMTRCYRVKPEMQSLICGAISRDGTCRPQIVRDDSSGVFAKLLRAIKEQTSHGVIINTSFNLHGEPIVASPEDALKTFVSSPLSYLAIEDYLVSK